MSCICFCIHELQNCISKQVGISAVGESPIRPVRKTSSTDQRHCGRRPWSAKRLGKRREDLIESQSVMIKEIMHEKTFLIAVSSALLLCVPFSAPADPPDGYYDSVETTDAATLRATLHEIIDDHSRFPYTSSNTDTWDILAKNVRGWALIRDRVIREAPFLTTFDTPSLAAPTVISPPEEPDC